MDDELQFQQNLDFQQFLKEVQRQDYLSSQKGKRKLHKKFFSDKESVETKRLLQFKLRVKDTASQDYQNEINSIFKPITLERLNNLINFSKQINKQEEPEEHEIKLNIEESAKKEPAQRTVFQQHTRQIVELNNDRQKGKTPNKKVSEAESMPSTTSLGHFVPIFNHGQKPSSKKIKFRADIRLKHESQDLQKQQRYAQNNNDIFFQSCKVLKPNNFNFNFDKFSPDHTQNHQKSDRNIVSRQSNVNQICETIQDRANMYSRQSNHRRRISYFTEQNEYCETAESNGKYDGGGDYAKILIQEVKGSFKAPQLRQVQSTVLCQTTRNSIGPFSEQHGKLQVVIPQSEIKEVESVKAQSHYPRNYSIGNGIYAKTQGLMFTNKRHMINNQMFLLRNFKASAQPHHLNEPKIQFSRNWNMKETNSLIQLQKNVRKLKYLEKVDEKMIQIGKTQKIMENPKPLSRNETRHTIIATPQINMFSMAVTPKDHNSGQTSQTNIHVGISRKSDLAANTSFDSIDLSKLMDGGYRSQESQRQRL